MLIDFENGKEAEIKKKGEDILNLRYFSVESLTIGEFYYISSDVLDRMKKTYHAPSRKFYKKMIE
jgi:hypothetical protein